MELGTLLTTIKNSLSDENIYRTNTFLTQGINDGYRLTALLTLFDERKTTIRVTGTRNLNTLPTVSSAPCFAPLYLANTETGTRVNPVELEQFEYHANQWEGQVGDGDTLYYTVLNHSHHALSELYICPIQNIGITKLTFLGAFIPNTVSSSTDTFRLDDEFVDILYYYTRFYAATSEPGRAALAQQEFKLFTQRINEYIIVLSARFPSGRDYEPIPVEVDFDAGVIPSDERPK